MTYRERTRYSLDFMIQCMYCKRRIFPLIPVSLSSSQIIFFSVKPKALLSPYLSSAMTTRPQNVSPRIQGASPIID
jgi:hypothetical protein